MRLNPAVLALSLGLLTAAAPVLAQDQSTGETPAQRAARRAAMPQPVLEEDQALKTAIETMSSLILRPRSSFTGASCLRNFSITAPAAGPG